MGLSSNEKRAAQLGISLKDYKSSSEYYSKKSKKSNKESKKEEKKSKKKIKKYYKEKEGFIKEEAELKTKRLQEDLDKIYKEAGIEKTRAIEDYNRNIGNIEQNKSADVSDINDYVSVNKGRTQEDLDTALAKETRRYALEYDQINQDLADRGLTFSERTPEQVAKETSALAKQGIQTEAERNFQDIARYEAAKTRDVELKYGQQTAEADTGKTRTLEDIANAQTKAIQSNARGVEDVGLGLKESLWETSYAKDTDIATTGQLFESNRLQNELNQQKYNLG